MRRLGVGGIYKGVIGGRGRRRGCMGRLGISFNKIYKIIYEPPYISYDQCTYHQHTHKQSRTHIHTQTHTLPTNHTAFNLGGGGGAFMGSSLAAPTNVGGALGAPQAPNEAWVQQINEHIKALNRSPYGDSPLFKNLVLVAGCMGWLCVVG